MKTLLKNFAKKLKKELKETAQNANYVLSR
jgi:hypothetical protein